MKEPVARFQVPGFPRTVGKELELAPLGELLAMPMFHRARWGLFRKKATRFQRALADAAPLVGHHRHVYVDCCVQYLQPGVSSLGSRGGYGLHGWHIDGIARTGDEPSVFHAVTSPCSAQTEFNTSRFALDLDEDSVGAINARLGARRHRLPLEGRPMPAGRFVTWTTHVHRAVPPRHRDLRFFFRITESSLMPPTSDDRAILRTSVVHVGGSAPRALPSVSQEADRIVLHLPPR